MTPGPMFSASSCRAVVRWLKQLKGAVGTLTFDNYDKSNDEASRHPAPHAHVALTHPRPPDLPFL